MAVMGSSSAAAAAVAPLPESGPNALHVHTSKMRMTMAEVVVGSRSGGATRCCQSGFHDSRTVLPIGIKIGI